jgi:hypothetical protein
MNTWTYDSYDLHDSYHPKNSALREGQSMPLSPTENYIPSSRKFVVASLQPTTISLFLDIIFKNDVFIIYATPYIFVTMACIFIFYVAPDTKVAMAGPFGLSRGWYLLIFCAIIFIVAAATYAFLPVKKAEGSAAFLSPPEPACRPTRVSAKTAIVLIHGWNGGADTTWSNFPELLCQDDAFSDTEIFVVNYPTFMARRQLKISNLARWLRQSFFSDALRNYENIHIIAHSMGGLIARSIYIQDKLGGSSKIRSIVSIASPYLGAEASQLAAALGISKDLTEDMAPNSDFVKTLEDNWTDTYPKPQTYCFTSPMDGIVSSLSAKSQCECTHDYPEWNHTEMVKPEVRTDERYQMPVRGLKNAIAADNLSPSAGRPQCFSLARTGDCLNLAFRR